MRTGLKLQAKTVEAGEGIIKEKPVSSIHA
jgi:hypothetical protein